MKNKKEFDNISSIVILTLISSVCLAPFLNKAFHIDDPLFLWSAMHIQTDPTDFYAFDVNWYGKEMPMSLVTKNPPLASYYIAFVAYLFGWGEATLHSAFLIFAITAAIGTYLLSREFCSRPLVAALAGVLTPVFLLSSTTVMCDIMMLSFWVWALFFGIVGIKKDSIPFLVIANIFITVCSLTKYYGIVLIPLLFVYALAKKRRPGSWAIFFLIPVATLAAYQWLTYNLYGRGLLSDAFSFAMGYRNPGGSDFLTEAITGLSFTGGSFIIVLFCSFFLWKKRTLVIGLLLTTLLVLIFSYLLPPSRIQTLHGNGFNWAFIVQCLVFSFAGAGVLSLAVTDIWRRKDAESLLLFFWVIGTFVFASFLNWSVNGRTFLPMAPAVGMLLLRRMEYLGSYGPQRDRLIFLPLALSLLVSISVVNADYRLANAASRKAEELSLKYTDTNIWFQGHWGFQYYMEKFGGKAIDMTKLNITPGDVLIIPLNNINIHQLPDNLISNLLEISYIEPHCCVTTMNESLGAGFYSGTFGLLPFALGPVPDEEYYVFQAAEPR